MRIIAGFLKGRSFHSPPGHRSHPMSDKIRGALFNILGDIKGLTFLDAFAGSGALALEAASRGAKHVTAIEKDSPAYTVIVKNVKELGLAKLVHASRANVGGWSNHNMEAEFDIVLLDPPYDLLQLSLLTKLARRHVKASGLVVLSYPGQALVPGFEDFEIAANKHYGDAQLVFYRKRK